MGSLNDDNRKHISIVDENKSVIFVKMTDSILKSIDEFMKNKDGSNPKIQLNGHSGAIYFPTENGTQKYSFSLSDIGGKENEASNNIPNRSFECIQQNSDGSLESLGSITTKMQIRAKEDSYENTRFKMAAAEKEQKQFCTKEIKPAGSHIGHQIKINHPKITVFPPNSYSAPAAKSIGPLKPNTRIGFAVHQPVPSVRRNSNPSARRTSLPSVSEDRLGYTPASLQKKESFHPKQKVPSAFQHKPLRDRFIHLLALRPYKKPEIIRKVLKEGVKKKDNNSLTGILSQVSTIRNNIYYLSDGLWSEVQDNWKFYSPEDAEIARKNKQLYFEKKSFSDIQSSLPAKKNVLNENPTNAYPTCKKQRISRFNGYYRQLENPENAVKSPSTLTAGALQTNRVSRNDSFADTLMKDVNRVSQPTMSSSPEYYRRKVDANSPSTRSSGYVSKSASQSPDEYIISQSKKHDHQFQFSAHSEQDNHNSKMENSSMMARKKGSGLCSLVSSTSLESRIRSYIQSTPDPSSEKRTHKKKSDKKHSVFSDKDQKKKRDNQGSSVLSSDLRSKKKDSHPSSVESPTLECEKREGLKIVLTHTVEQGFKIKNTKSHEPSKESVRPKHKRNIDVSPIQSPRPVKKSSAADISSKVNCSMMNGHPKYEMQHDKPSTSQTEQHLVPSTQAVAISESHHVASTTLSSEKESSMMNDYPKFEMQHNKPSTSKTEQHLMPSTQAVAASDSSHAADTTLPIEGDNTNSDASEKQFESYTDDYKREYVKIESKEQRDQYKAFYNIEYQAYNELLQELQKIHEKFVALDKEYEFAKWIPEDFRSIERIEKKAREEYRAACDFEYMKKLKKSKYLYLKLSHIQKLVAEWDHKNIKKND